MIKVNLLPREVYAVKAQKQLQAIGIGLGAAVALAAIGYYLLLLNTSRRLDQQLADAKAELQKYEAIDREVNDMRAKEGQLSSRLSVIQQLLRGTLTYPKFFEDFMALLPADVWIGTLTTTTDASNGLAVTVSAQALSSSAVTDWLSNLQPSPLCSDVRLGSISVTEQGEGASSTSAFTINCTYLTRDS